MKKLAALCTGLALMLATASAMALPVPAPSFTVGSVTFSDFAAVLNTGSFTTPADLSGISITPTMFGDHPGFVISGGFSAAGFDGATSLDLLLSYTATTSVGLIHDVGLSFNGAVLRDPGFASVTESVYADAGHQNLLGTATVVTPSPMTVETVLSEQVKTVYVTKDIILAAFPGGIVSLSDIDQNISLTPVPEPGTMLLLGAGFLGLAIYGKRRKSA